MAMFNSAKAVDRSKANAPKNAGFVLKIEEVATTDGGVILRGVAESESSVSKVGVPTEVFMDAGDFKYSLGHNLARSLRDFPKRDPDWFAGTEVVLSVCYEKDGRLQAKRGAVGTYCVAGQVDSPRSITSAVVGRPVIELIDANEKAVITMSAHPVDAKDVGVQIRRNGSSANFNVPLEDFVQGLHNKAAEQEAINKRILDGNGYEKPVLRVSLPVYSPKDSFKVDSAEQLKNRKGSVMLVAENGKSGSFVFSESQTPEDLAKTLERAGKFIEANGQSVGVPYFRIDYNKMKAVELGTAFANYLGTLSANMSFQERWASHEKVLSAFNNLDGKFTPANLIMETFNDKETGTPRFSMERVVASVNQSVDAMPGISFNGAPPPVVAEHEESIDVSTLEVGVSDGDLGPALADAMGDQQTAQQRRPRNPSLSM